MTKDWTIPPDWLDWAVGFALDRGFSIGRAGAEQLGRRFHDHFLNKRGPDGAALDWLARWRTWCARAESFGELEALAKRPASATQSSQDAISRAR